MRAPLVACLMVSVLTGCGPSLSDGPDYQVTDNPSTSAPPDEGAAAPSGSASGAPDDVPSGAPDPTDASTADAGADAGADAKADAKADAAPPAPRVAATTTVWSRKISLHLDDADKSGWATIENGSPTDEVWLDRSFDGGAHWGPQLGYTRIPSGQRSTRTAVYSVYENQRKGQLRACGKAGNRPEIACTPWRTTL